MKIKSLFSTALLGSALMFGASAQAMTGEVHFLGNLNPVDIVHDEFETVNDSFTDIYNFSLDAYMTSLTVSLNEHRLPITQGSWALDIAAPTLKLFNEFDSELTNPVSPIVADNGADGYLFIDLEAGNYYFQVTGTTVGLGNSEGQRGHYTLSTLTTEMKAPPPVPEAETYAMLLGGLGVIGFAAARRRKQQA